MTTLPCPPQLWPRFSTLLDTAMDLPERARAAWLDGLSGDDAAFRPWLDRVLSGAAAARTASFLNQPESPLPPEAVFHAGDMLGPYQLEELLGEGGMGQVWRASRPGDDGPRREVAVKLPQPELLAGAVRARFRRERDVLAALSHAHIAQLYDAGVSGTGHPYLALELVRGRSITEHCRATGASVARRMQLILQVLDALSYAHRRLIVHRDIKPSNVMVTQEGDVKLLDFGIAKLLQTESTGEQPLTQMAGSLATPGYGAPEQFTGAAVTVAADIFSTGVVLFEILTGERPFARIPTDPEAAPSRLASHCAEPGRIGCPDARLSRKLRGDIDAILAKALALSPDDRYASAESFRRDVQRWLDGLPVAARRVGWATRARKFVARNKVGVGLASVLALAIASGVTGIAWQWRRAEHEAARATAIKNYLIGLFQEGAPGVDSGKPSPERTAKELLDRGTDHADAAFANDPATEMDLLASLGDIYDELGDEARSEGVGTRRLQLARALYGPDDPRVIESTIQLVNSEVLFNDNDKAITHLETIRSAVFQHYGADSLQRAEFLFAEGLALEAAHGKLPQALADATEAVRIFGTYYPDNRDYGSALSNLAFYQMAAEQYREAADSFRHSHAADAANGDVSALNKVMDLVDTGHALRLLGQRTEGIGMLDAGAARAKQLLGTNADWYLVPLLYEAEGLHLIGQRDRADALFRQLIATTKTGVDSERFVSERYGQYFGSARAREGSKDAIALLEPALARVQLHPHFESDQRVIEGALGDAYDQAGNADKARAYLAAARDEWMRFGLPHTNKTLSARERWARFLLDHGDAAGAEAEFRAVVAATQVPGPAAALAQAGLAHIALARGDVARADADATQALAALQAITIEYDKRTDIEIWLVCAQVRKAEGKPNEARGWAQRALQAAQTWDAPESPQLARARAVMAQ